MILWNIESDIRTTFQQTRPNPMKKDNHTYRQLSLFGDGFLDGQSPETGEQAATAKKEDIEEAFSKEKEDRAAEEADKSENDTRIDYIKPSAQDCDKSKEKIRVREKRLLLRVSFEDGTQICCSSATQTVIDTIRKIGVEKVAALNMEACHIPLVGTEINPRYRQWTKKICDGWYLMAQSDTKQKYMQLKSIIMQLGTNATVELGDFAANATTNPDKAATRRKKKAQMEVVLANGSIIRSSDPMHTFKEVAEHIGISKIKKTNLNVGKFPIITYDKKANNQLQTSTGEWLTVPTAIKDKYKILRVISSMTHIPFEIKIIEQ